MEARGSKTLIHTLSQQRLKILSTFLMVGMLLLTLLLPSSLQAQDQMPPPIGDEGPEQQLIYSPETVE